MKRLLTATAIALGLLTGTAHADSPASDHGYATAALEKVCFGMTVTDAKLRAKLDKKYRNTADFKDGYDWVTKRIDAAYKGWDYNLVIWQTCTNPAVTDAKWLHQDPEMVTGQKLRMERDEAHQNKAR